jgi:hypothetical protein
MKGITGRLVTCHKKTKEFLASAQVSMTSTRTASQLCSSRSDTQEYMAVVLSFSSLKRHNFSLDLSKLEKKDKIFLRNFRN